ncbi:MAG TPA: hypothetical protein VF868_13625 [Bacteroidia bacterium]|jgi:hypothetical protein
MTNSENTIPGKWQRKSAKAKGTILFLIALIGILPVVTGYYKYWRTKNVNGKWKITCHIKSSTYKAYVGKSSGFKIYLTQDDDKIKGQGEMWWVDDKEIPYEQHLPITVEGKVDGENMVLSYTQVGSKRTTVGEMVLNTSGGDVLNGSFSGTAADAKGTVTAERIN